MTTERHLIVNADDFGQSHGVNCGIIEAYEKGIVTSASLMVRRAAAEEAATYGREHPKLSIGLHLDLCEWIYRDETWSPLYEVVPIDDAFAIAEEVNRQLMTFRRLVGQEPTHLDSHQHVHRSEPVLSVMTETARQLGVPLRDCNSEISYCGSFYGQSANGHSYPEGISIDGLLTTLKTLSSGVTELGCHPGLSDNEETMYSAERIQEVRVLCDPRVRAAIDAEEIELHSFRNIGVRGALSVLGDVS